MGFKILTNWCKNLHTTKKYNSPNPNEIKQFTLLLA